MTEIEPLRRPATLAPAMEKTDLSHSTDQGWAINVREIWRYRDLLWFWCSAISNFIQTNGAGGCLGSVSAAARCSGDFHGRFWPSGEASDSAVFIVCFCRVTVWTPCYQALQRVD